MCIPNYGKMHQTKWKIIKFNVIVKHFLGDYKVQGHC